MLNILIKLGITALSLFLLIVIVILIYALYLAIRTIFKGE